MSKTKTKGLVSRADEVISYRPKPTLRIDSKDYPEIKNLKVGEVKTFTVTAKVKFISEGDEYGDDYRGEERDKTVRARLTITKITEK